jgi:hypothetical protein
VYGPLECPLRTSSQGSSLWLWVAKRAVGLVFLADCLPRATAAHRIVIAQSLGADARAYLFSGATILPCAAFGAHLGLLRVADRVEAIGFPYSVPAHFVPAVFWAVPGQGSGRAFAACAVLVSRFISCVGRDSDPSALLHHKSSQRTRNEWCEGGLARREARLAKRPMHEAVVQQVAKKRANLRLVILQ